MANNHAHGAFGAQIIGNRNLTQHSTSMSITPAVDTSEDTGMSPVGDYKTFLQGLRGMAASSNGLLPNLPSLLAKERRHLAGISDDTVELLTLAWFGFGLGMYVSLPYSRKTSYSIPVSNSSTVTTSTNHQCTAEWHDGHALFNPFGSSTTPVNEVQTLKTVLGVYAGGAVPVVGPSTTQTITPGDSLGTIQGKIALAYGVTSGHIVAAGTSTATVGQTLSNVTLNKTVSPVSGGGVTNTFGIPTALNDGNNTTQAIPNGGNPAAAVIDTGQAQIIASVTLRSPDIGGTFSIYGSNNPNGFTGRVLLATITGYTASVDTTVASSDLVNTYRYITVQTSGLERIIDFSASTLVGGTLGVFDLTFTYSGTSVASKYVALPTTPTTGVTIAQKIRGGSGNEAIWNPISATTTADAHDAAAFLPDVATSTATGFYARMQLPLVNGSALTVIVEHSDSVGTGYTTLNTFTVTDVADVTQLAQEYSAPAGTVVKRYVRARISAITGTFAVAVCYARESYA